MCRCCSDLDCYYLDSKLLRFYARKPLVLLQKWGFEVNSAKPSTSSVILIAGAGIGGLASALALAQRGWRVHVIERSDQLAEAGAGIQLGPNAVRVIAALSQGAKQPLRERVLASACLPESIAIRDAKSGKSIQRILLGKAVEQKYGEVYASIHRADLQAALLEAVHQQPGITLALGESFERYETHADHVNLHTTRSSLSHQREGANVMTSGATYEGAALIGADGLWSPVRQQLLADGPPLATGHTAFRTLVPREQVPDELRKSEVGVWWGRDVHVVHYPVRGGSHWSIAVLAEIPKVIRASMPVRAEPVEVQANQVGWSLEATHAEVLQATGQVTPLLRDILSIGEQTGWRRWNLFDRKPIAQITQGRVALLGDAAHPMLPYLAQGAAMSLEDAWQLATSIEPCCQSKAGVEQQLHHYATARYSRTTRVVDTARRNGKIFHMSGLIAEVRDSVLSLQGTQVLGLNWLYRYALKPV
jgi:salicylate hydroxylase